MRPEGDHQQEAAQRNHKYQQHAGAGGSPVVLATVRIEKQSVRWVGGQGIVAMVWGWLIHGLYLASLVLAGVMSTLPQPYARWAKMSPVVGVTNESHNR